MLRGKGYYRESYWVPGVNNPGYYNRWTFAMYVGVWEM
jgi:hypothetical protein